MPRWGRPPGARQGRQTRGRVAHWADDDSRVQEIDSEDEYMMHAGRAAYARQLASMEGNGGPGRQRQMLDYHEYRDDAENPDVLNYDLYDDGDSTVAYAVQLAMKDKEENLVDKALDRIRHAQMLGHKNVRLSKPEVEALERKRIQTNGVPATKSVLIDSRRMKPTNGSSGGSPGKTGLRPRGASASKGKPSARAPMASDVPGSWAWSTGNYPPTPVSQRPQSPRSPPKASYSVEPYHNSPYGRPATAILSPSYSRPLPDDPYWVPPYQHKYSSQPPGNPERAGRPGMGPFMSSFLSTHRERQSGSVRKPTAHVHVLSESGSDNSSGDDAHDEDESESNEGGDGLQFVDVVQRKVPASPSPRARSGGSGRQRNSHS